MKQRQALAVEGEWLLGRGWDEGKLKEQRYVTSADLDPVTGESPAWLMHTMGHYGTANTAALRLAGIDTDTPDPPGGVIERDAEGRPTGVLKERAMALVMQHIPEGHPGQLNDAIGMMARELNRECMTAAKDPGIGRSLGYHLDGAKSAWHAYQEVEAAGDLTVRVFALWRGAETVEQARELVSYLRPFTRPDYRQVSDRLVSGGIKLFADGSGGARTAWMWRDWNRDRTGIDEGNRGYPAIDPDLLRELIQIYHDAGLHLGIHAVGDRAIDWVVAALTNALLQNPIHGLRHSIIHANIPSDLALNSMGSIQKQFDALYPETQPGFTWWIGDTYAGNFGVERSQRLNPYRSYLDRGIRWAAGSDFFVTPYPARYGLWASIRRQPLLGVYGNDAFGTRESVDIRAALRSYTIWAAHQLFMEERSGSLEVDKYADIAVWDINPYTAEADKIRDMKCQMTLLEGKVVYLAE
jgi:predicted amidohydrolase YtcJ